MAKTKIDSQRETKVNLNELTNIPSDEFEKHFRDWMERDDVARSLQAKLRTDLIANFNKTALGKHILAQTTTTTGGGVTQRLTLCPLTLVLNTLVAEFLYAGNCHFTLSVFCTEVPYRNTLPDFESMRHFRFNEEEISEILTAVTGEIAKSEKSLITNIAHEYENGSGSLLLFIIQMLLEKIKQQASTLPKLSQHSQLQQPVKVSKPIAANDRHVDGKDAQHEFKTEVYNSNFRYLNKYLIILSKKVNEMTQQFQSLQQKTERNATNSYPRVLKTTQTRKFENLNRSLERITKNLKLMSHAKRRSKHVGAIVTAIEGLALQFTKCAANFENVSRGFGGKTTTVSYNSFRGTGKKRVGSVEKQTETDVVGREEKSYLDWIQEMRNTINGQKFLDRIGIALRKALSKQRDQLSNETEMKLRHQKELLKIRYKQKLMEELTRHGQGSMEHSIDTRKINANIEQKLQQFEQKHFELLHKIHETEAELIQLPSFKTPTHPIEKTSEESSNVETITTKQTAVAAAIVIPTPVAKPLVKATKLPILKDAVNTQKQLQQIVKNMAIQEHTVDHIVYDAKLRIQELENESNQLEQSFLNYLERQRLEKEASNKLTAKVWDYYAIERDKMWQRFKEGSFVSGGCDLNKNAAIKLFNKGEENDDDDLLPLQQIQLKQLQSQQQQQKTQCDLPVQFKETNFTSIQKASPTNTHRRNAIHEAKEMFFEKKRRYMKHVERQIDFISLPIAIGSEEDEFDCMEGVSMLKEQPKQNEMNQNQQMPKLVDIKHKAIEESNKQAIGNMRMRESCQETILQQMQFTNEWEMKQSQRIPTTKTLPQSENVATPSSRRSIATATHALNEASLSFTATTSKNATVIKESMAKMQLLFNSDPLAKIDGVGREQKLSATTNIEPTSSLITNDELVSNTNDNSVSTVVPQKIAAMLNTTTSTISVISSVASENTIATITENTSIEQKQYPQISVLSAISLPQLKESELPVMGLNMSNKEKINESSSSTNGDDGPASIEVVAIFHAGNNNAKTLSEKLEEVVDVENIKLATNRNESPEIGEIVEKSSKTSAFIAIDQKLATARTTLSSEDSSIELQFSMTSRRNNSDSDSDFWA